MVASSSRWTTNRLWKGRGYVMWHVLNVGCPIHISGMAETRALKFFLQRATILSLAKRMTNHPKRGVVLLTWPIFCLHSCGVWKKYPLHSVTAINRVLDDGYRLSHLQQSTLVLHTLKLKLNRFDFSPCLLQTCLSQAAQSHQPCVNSHQLSQWEPVIFDHPQNRRPLTDR